MPAYVDTGLNIVAVQDVARGHLLAEEKGRVGERYILGGENWSLEEILDPLAHLSGRLTPRFRIPSLRALFPALLDHLIPARILRSKPIIPPVASKMAEANTYRKRETIPP